MIERWPQRLEPILQKPSFLRHLPFNHCLVGNESLESLHLRSQQPLIVGRAKSINSRNPAPAWNLSLEIVLEHIHQRNVRTRSIIRCRVEELAYQQFADARLRRPPGVISKLWKCILPLIRWNSMGQLQSPNPNVVFLCVTDKLGMYKFGIAAYIRRERDCRDFVQLSRF
jgi:hypothetical protein